MWDRVGEVIVVALLALVASAPARAAPVWSENATKVYRDSELNLPWANVLGDWTDAKGRPMGATPFAQATAAQGREPLTVAIDVTGMVREHGADFRINGVGGIAVLASRRAPDGAPALRVTTAAGTRTLAAAAMTELNINSFKALSDRPTMRTNYGVLVRFDQPADARVTRAVLVLTAIKRQKGDVQLKLFRPAALDRPAIAERGASFELKRPAFLKTNPRSAGTLSRVRPPAPGPGPTRVLLNVDGAELKKRDNNRPNGRALEAWFEGTDKTAVSQFIAVPGARAEAYLTVVLKLGEDWTAPGGKLPGLANTGHTVPLCVVRGAPMAPGGWGGRKANACHWSARTAYRGVASGATGAGTYVYAISPKDVNGVVDWWSQPLPKGRWVAYVERVKLNDPGRANGEVAYWLVDRQSAAGGKLVQSAGGIVFRDTDQPQSAINELWADVYCGGRDCGAAPWPRSTVFLRRLTVTDALPDLGAVQAEVDRLNAGR